VRRLLLIVVGVVGAAGATGCGSCGTDGVNKLPDAPILDDSGDIDGPPIDAAITGGVLVVTVSPPGPANNDPATWGGVVAYEIASDDGAATQITGIDKALLADPVAVIYRATSQEIFVAERHGNNAADGVAGSIARFAYSPTSRAFTPSGRITGANITSGVHDMVLHPTTGELFACNVSTGISRFTFTGNTAVPNGMLSDGACRGLAISPNGSTLYMSTAGNVIRRYDLTTNAELPATTATGAPNLHFMAQRQGQLYVAALDAARVYRFQINANNTLSELAPIETITNPSAVAFSESSQEMFVAGHRSTPVVGRYRFDLANDTWIPTSELALGASTGGLVVLPIR
jgi:6-phosphogluconolactonase (cycloisomerase 2 family)